MVSISKRGVQVALGVLWLLDGALQLQPQMFTSSFATQVIAPAVQGQPEIVRGPMDFAMHLFLMHPAIFNALFALTQLAIGALILWKRTARLGLLFSIPWGLIVWSIGEGYGGVLSGHTLLLMGAPGAVILYVLLALATLMPDSKHKQTAYWLAIVWLVIWVGGGVYQLLPGQNSTADVSSMIVGNAQGAPKWLASIDRHAANAVNDLGRGSRVTSAQPDNGMDMTSAQMVHMSNQPYSSSHTDQGGLYILLLAILQLVIGLGVLFKGAWRKTAIWFGILLSLVFWIVGESLGGYYTGLATDPNIAPLFLVMGLAILGTTDLDEKLARLAYRIQCATVGKPAKEAKSS